MAQDGDCSTTSLDGQGPDNVAQCYVYINEPGSPPPQRNGSTSISVPQGRHFVLVRAYFFDAGRSFNWAYPATVNITGGDMPVSISNPASGTQNGWCQTDNRDPGYPTTTCDLTIGVPVRNVTAGGPATLTMSISLMGSPGGGATSGSGNTFIASIDLFADVGVTATMPDYSFRPRDAMAPPAESGCQGELAFNCNPTISFEFAPAFLAPTTARFGLSLVGATNLTGAASNVGDQTTPDFDFVTTQGPNAGADLTGTMIVASQGKQQIAIRSLDYGGSVRVSPFVRFYDPRDPRSPNPGTDFPVQTIVQPKASGATENPFNLANLPKLPVDEDNDGMADSWEEAHGGMSLKPEDDKDSPPAVTLRKESFAGDGIQAIDEYRGFRVLMGENLRWTDTDPVREKDLFIWSSQRSFTDALNSIFIPEAAGALRTWLVNARDSGARNRRQPLRGTDRLVRTRAQAPEVHALILARDRIQRQVQGVDATRILGEAPTTPSFVNAGGAIRIDEDAIESVSTSENFPRATLISQVIAHEISHNLSIVHHTRNASFLETFDESAISALTLDRCMREIRGSNSRYYFRANVYLHEGRNRLAESIAIPLNIPFREHRAVGNLAVPTSIISASIPGRPNRPGIVINSFERSIMDWAPYLNLTSPTDWHWTATERGSFCIKREGCY